MEIFDITGLDSAEVLKAIWDSIEEPEDFASHDYPVNGELTLEMCEEELECLKTRVRRGGIDSVYADYIYGKRIKCFISPWYLKIYKSYNEEIYGEGTLESIVDELRAKHKVYPVYRNMRHEEDKVLDMVELTFETTPQMNEPVDVQYRIIFESGKGFSIINVDATIGTDIEWFVDEKCKLDNSIVAESSPWRYGTVYKTDITIEELDTIYDEFLKVTYEA